MKQLIKELAEKLDSAAMDAKPIEQLSMKNQISIFDAYSIQKKSIERRYHKGEKMAGLKLGFTSKAKMRQMGVNDLIWGRLTDSMEIANNGSLAIKKFIHPRAEPEIAFLLKKDVDGIVGQEDAMHYISGVAAAIEIIDSRYKDFKFSLEDVIADNCSSAAFVLGEWHEPDTDVSNVQMTISINNAVIESGSSKAIMGNPLLSFIEALRLAHDYGVQLKKDMVILAGAATPAIYLNNNDLVCVAVEKLGEVNLKVD